MKTSSIKALKYLLLLPITIIMMSCEPSDSSNRYEAFDIDPGAFCVIDKKTSEVFIYDGKIDAWVSVGKPSETSYTRANRPTQKVSY